MLELNTTIVFLIAWNLNSVLTYEERKFTACFSSAETQIKFSGVRKGLCGLYLILKTQNSIPICEGKEVYSVSVPSFKSEGSQSGEAVWWFLSSMISVLPSGCTGTTTHKTGNFMNAWHSFVL